MIREDEEDEVPRPPAPHEQRFDTRIEDDLGYEIADPDLKDRIADEVYNPKRKAEYSFDPTVAPDREGQPLFTMTSYATNTGSLEEDEEQPTNLVASAAGYVMPKTMGEAEKDAVGEEVEATFGRKTPQDDEEEEEESSSDEEEKKKKKKKKKKEKEKVDSPHKPYAQLDTLEEDNEYSPAKGSKQHPKGAERIQVAVRLRPMTKDEMVTKNKKKKEGGPEGFMAWDVDDDGDLDVLIQKGSRSRVEGKNMFHVDAVFEEQDTTDSMYTDICKPIMTAVVNGQHGTIFGYGQTGGGKSFTMQGGKGAKGIIQLAAKDLFQQIAEDTRREYSVKASYFEIYNEQVQDLMGFDESEDAQKSRRATAVITTVNKTDVELPVLNIREDSKGGDVNVNAQFTKVSNVENIKRVLHKGNRNRATEKTKSNDFSSRSHAIFRLTVESHEPVPEGTDVSEGIVMRVAALNFVDLAGSENSAKAATSGKTKREGGKINQSLLSLTQVIHQLSLPPKKRPKHINYRDSKLTRILQPHLSGNAAISIICCCTPAKKMVEETRSTLKFAYNAKRIKLRPQVNEIVDDKVLIENLKKELTATKMKLQDLKEFQHKNPPAPETDDEFPMIEKFFAKMNPYMNASIRSEDFADALEEMSGLSMGSGGGGGTSALGGEGAAAGPAGEEDEDDVEAFRRQILAKFMNEMDDEEGVNGETADTTMDDTNANNTTMGETTVADTTLGDATTGGETTDVDTSLNRTVMTDDTAATHGTQDASGRQHAASSSPSKGVAPGTQNQQTASTPQQQQGIEKAPTFAGPPEISRELPGASKPALPFAQSPKPATPRDPVDQVKRSFIDSDESSTSTPQVPPNESDLNLIERFREEILEKFRDEIVDEEAAHELDENAQNVAVIANELINKFKREIVYKYKDEFPELLVKRMEVDLAATPVGDNGIVGRVIERAAVGESPASDPELNTSDDSSANGSVEQFEDEFDEVAKLGNAAGVSKQETKQADEGKAVEHRNVPARTFSTQTTRAVINGRAPFGFGGTGANSNKPDPPIPPMTSALGRSASGSVSSDLSSDVADKKAGSAISPLPANPPDDEYALPPGEIAISNGDGEPGSMEGKMRINFLEEKLLATDELVETLFVELENAKTFIRELVFENAGGGGGGALDPSGAALFGPAGTSGVTVVDEQILNQCEILKFAIYTSLLFFVFGQHELFLATVFFLWLSLEVATKT